MRPSAGVPVTSLRLSPPSQFVGVPPPSLLLQSLLRAGGGDVQESPGCVGVELLLVTAQRPNVHHPHHLLLSGEDVNTGSAL